MKKENQRLKEQLQMLVKDDEKSQETIINQKQNIEKLQKQLDMEKKINENNTDAYMKLLHTSQALEERIGKAIRYIKKCREYHNSVHKTDYLYPDEITSLLMVLGGEYDEK